MCDELRFCKGLGRGGNDAVPTQAHVGISEHIHALEFVDAHRERGKNF